MPDSHGDGQSRSNSREMYTVTLAQDLRAAGTSAQLATTVKPIGTGRKANAIAWPCHVTLTSAVEKYQSFTLCLASRYNQLSDKGLVSLFIITYW